MSKFEHIQVILTFHLSFLLPASVFGSLPLIPEIVEFLSPLPITFPSFNFQYKIMEDDTALNPHDSPKMLFMCVDLDLEIKQ